MVGRRFCLIMPLVKTNNQHRGQGMGAFRRLLACFTRDKTFIRSSASSQHIYLALDYSSTFGVFSIFVGGVFFFFENALIFRSVLSRWTAVAGYVCCCAHIFGPAAPGLFLDNLFRWLGQHKHLDRTGHGMLWKSTLAHQACPLPYILVATSGLIFIAPMCATMHLWGRYATPRWQVFMMPSTLRLQGLEQ